MGVGKSGLNAKGFRVIGRLFCRIVIGGVRKGIEYFPRSGGFDTDPNILQAYYSDSQKRTPIPHQVIIKS